MEAGFSPPRSSNIDYLLDVRAQSKTRPPSVAIIKPARLGSDRTAKRASDIQIPPSPADPVASVQRRLFKPVCFCRVWRGSALHDQPLLCTLGGRCDPGGADDCVASTRREARKGRSEGTGNRLRPLGWCVRRRVYAQRRQRSVKPDQRVTRRSPPPPAHRRRRACSSEAGRGRQVENHSKILLNCDCPPVFDLLSIVSGTPRRLFTFRLAGVLFF